MVLSPQEMAKLVKECDKLKDGPDYHYGYVSNLVRTAIDFQNKSITVRRALAHFKDKHRGVKTHDNLKLLLSSCPDNTDLAKHLWGNRMWTRAGFFRVLVEHFNAEGIFDEKRLRLWLNKAVFERDIKGQFTFRWGNSRGKQHNLGYAGFKWLQVRCGINTVKPDVHTSNFVKRAIERRVSQKQVVEALNAVAKISHRKANRLDSAIWLFERKDPDRTSERMIRLVGSCSEVRRVTK